jgi:hypothetical protein
MSDDAPTTAIRVVVAGSFHDKGHRKVWARLLADDPEALAFFDGLIGRNGCHVRFQSLFG